METRSPCLGCDRVHENKLKCAKDCERLALFQRGLPLVIKFTEDPSSSAGRAGRRRFRR